VIREPLAERQAGARQGFRFRSREISRFEGFSDAVLGFAVTLLVVSLEVPRTFPELLANMRGFAAFGICFAILVWVWYQQYLYFRRYGLEDLTSIVLNSVLLFVVLFYTYPLKFLFRLLVDQLTGASLTVISAAGRPEPVIEAAQAPLLMEIYGLGFVAIFAVFALLHVHAYRLRRELGLSPLEVFDTRESIQAALLNMAVGLISLAISFFALAGRYSSALSGWTYGLIGLFATVHGAVMGRRRRMLEEASGGRRLA
jgi:hypothetical protein